MAGIFVSYARKDSELVKKIMEELHGLGFDYWMDTRDMPAGEHWPEVLTEQIIDCNQFLLFMSTASMESDNVQREVQIAYEHNKKIMIVRLEKVEVPTSLKYQLARIQWTEYGEPDFLTRLTAALRGHPKQPRATKRSNAPTPSAVDQLFSEATRWNLQGHAARALQLYRQVKKIDPHYPDIDLMIANLEHEVDKGYVDSGGRIQEEKLQSPFDKRPQQIPMRRLPSSSLIALFACLVVSFVLFAQPLQTVLSPPATVSLLSTSTAFPTNTLADVPVPTDTVPAAEPTSTPSPDTPTPEPTSTPAPLAIGSDWADGCISTLWIPFPDTVQAIENDGCLLEPVHSFFTQDGRLIVVVNSTFEDAQVFGLFAPLPASGTVSIDAFLRALQASEIWIGIFAEPDIESQGMVIVIPPGNVAERPLVQKRMPGLVELQRTAELSKDPPLYDVVFELRNGVVTTRIAPDTLFNVVPVGSGQQWLFIGYQVLPGNNRIEAEFLNLVVEAQ